MAENRRERERRFYFSKAQMVILGGSFALASVLVFILGMFIGKEIEARKVVAPEESLVKVPVRPSSAGAPGAAGGKSKDDLTFYNTLTKTTAANPEGDTKNGEKTNENHSKEAVTEKKPQIGGEALSRVKAPAKSESKGETAAPEAKQDSQVWSVQVNAYPDERSARTLVDHLKEKGYDAYVTAVSVKGQDWYRVRVGRFAARGEAEKSERALKDKEGFAKAFLTRK